MNDPADARCTVAKFNTCHSDIADTAAANFVKPCDNTTELIIGNSKCLAKVNDV